MRQGQVKVWFIVRKVHRCKRADRTMLCHVDHCAHAKNLKDSILWAVDQKPDYHIL